MASPCQLASSFKIQLNEVLYSDLNEDASCINLTLFKIKNKQNESTMCHKKYQISRFQIHHLAPLNDDKQNENLFMFYDWFVLYNTKYRFDISKKKKENMNREYKSTQMEHFTPKHFFSCLHFNFMF